MELEEDVLLAREVVVEGCLCGTQPLGDLANRGVLVALLVEQLERDVENALAGRGAALLGLIGLFWLFGCACHSLSLLDDR